jgi:hypothetical protein
MIQAPQPEGFVGNSENDAVNADLHGPDAAPDPSSMPVTSPAPDFGPSPAPPTPTYTGGSGDSTVDMVGNKLSGQAPTTQKPRFWQSILMGALHGMAGAAGSQSFGEGLGLGVRGEFSYQQQELENKQKQQELDARIRFQDTESAYRAASLANLDKQLHLQEGEAQDRHNESVARLVTLNQENGVQYDIVPNTSANIAQYAEQGTGNARAAGANGITVHPGILVTTDSIYIPKGNASANIDAQYQTASGIATALGVPMLGKDAFVRLGQSGRDKFSAQLQNRLQGIDPTTGEYYASEKLNSAIGALDNQIKVYGQKVSSDDRLLQIMQSSLANMKAQKSQSDAAKDADSNRALDRQQALMDSRQKTEDARKYGYAFDSNGDAYYVSKADADSKGYNNFEPQTPATIKADVHDQRVLNDVALKSNNVREKAFKVDPSSWGALAKVLADNPNTTVNSIVKEKAFASLSKPAQDYAIAVLSLRESSMGLQKVLTGTARNNETQLQALLNTLPGLEPNSDVVNRKLDQFNQNMELLRAGIPKALPGMTQVPLSGTTGQRRELTNFHRNPKTGQQIGQDASGAWFDVATGQRVQ